VKVLPPAAVHPPINETGVEDGDAAEKFARRRPSTRADALAGLNEQQRMAVNFGLGQPASSADDATRDAPLLVIAGAGTGKTSTLAHRVAQLIAGGVDPHRLMLLTFSRRAANEMTRRVERILRRESGSAGGAPQLVWAGTFHSVGARLLREYAPAIGLDPAFTIHDREDSADLLNLTRHRLGLSTTQKRFPLKATCLAIYSAVLNRQAPLSEILHSAFPWCVGWESELKRLFLAYVEAKQAQQVLDYDDLLLYWAQMLEQAELASALGARFSHVLVDEYQDTNRLQARILLALKPDGRGLTVVGDDAQSIYSFRGATVRNILDFPQQFDPPAQRVTLERNYRSTQAILRAANAVIALAAERFGKNLSSVRESSARPRLVAVADDSEQAIYVAEQALARREEGIRLQAQAVLFRTAQHSARLEIELTRRGIPFVKFGGLKFLEAAHVKDVLSMLRWAQNPRDEVAGFRAVQLVAGVGPKTAGRLMANLAQAAPGCALLDEQPVGERAAAGWRDFVAVVEALAGPGVQWPAAFEDACRWYGEQLERLHADAEVRRADLEQLVRIALTYPSAERFLTELTLDPPEATSGEASRPLLDEDYLILSTIHSAKGQEWTAVTLLNAVDGCIPSDMATGSAEEIEEERRLLYVAMTRAKDHLDLLMPQRFYLAHQARLNDRHVYASRTRFIPNALLDHFEQVSWPQQPPDGRAPESSSARREAVDLAARMRAMWR